MAEKGDTQTSTATLGEAGSPGAKDSGSGSSSSLPKAVIKNVDMTEDMQLEAVDIASAALEKYSIEKDIAAQIKKEFDRRYGPTWHVVVGKNFGSYVTHGESALRHSSLRLRRLWGAGESVEILPIRLSRSAPLPRGSAAIYTDASLVLWQSTCLETSRIALILETDHCNLSLPRNQAFHLLLRRLARPSHLEVVNALPSP
ncbi:hypothetical protein EW145_g6332 [Phellinidium pouzarii]|uniref:Dynein light chain 1, cytoplasmic n=1 Tax=Phellinidium pouzarii TaxID=167371 RepID=A0A4S4KX59_9AGAM|nr:hypothetical protein EW145_g6332 [Phellinidium pouzarii]